MDHLSQTSSHSSSPSPHNLSPLMTAPPRRRARLQRSERLQSETSYSLWEALIRDSFGQVAWPIRITSWEVVNDAAAAAAAETVPTSDENMLCLNLKIAALFRMYRDDPVRDRSQSVFVPVTREPHRDIGALRVLQRRASSAISSATELISRRGVFSRRQYGSVDQLPQSELDGLDPSYRKYRLENGESLAEKDEVFGSPSTPILENPEHQTRWYFKYFLGKLHQIYVGLDAEKQPFFLSIVSQDSGNKCMPLYRAMLFRKQGAQKLALPYNSNQKLTVKQILSHFPSMDSGKTPKEIYAADIQKDLLLLEEQEGSVNFKFGVVYMKGGQKLDDEMLSNEYGSAEFDEFLGVLGERVRLKGWERYRGGLDVKGDMTGKFSVYTMYEGHEIMFHVSTLLPFSRDNRQQVERKRHIGNDIVNIVFLDGDPETCEFIPNNIKSQFTHVFAVVTKSNRSYKLAIYCDENVPPFGPTLPNPPEFEDPVAFRDFLLVKLINGEKATFQTPTFSRKRERTLEMLIKDLYEEYVHDSKMNMLNRRAFSEVLYDVPRTTKLKEDARQVEFVRIGQALKLEAIVRGDAPTSIASAGTVFKRPPWEPQCFYPSFNYLKPIVGDSWGQDALFISSEEGTCLIKDDHSQQLVFDKTLCVRQLNVVEDHGILLLRAGSASQKDNNRIHVFRLNEFKKDVIAVRSRSDVKDRRIEKTRGCHLYSLSRPGEAHLRMVVAVGKKILLLQWKHTAAWTSWCPSSDNDTVEGFLFFKEIHLHDSPTIITILEDTTRSRNTTGQLFCVGYKHHFEIVSEQTNQSWKLHEHETSKKSQSHLVAALDLYDGQDTELLLCYNHICHFQKVTAEECKTSSSEFDFTWNTSPTSIVCAFPYVIAFTADSMEIRLLVNGNLVHTVSMADLQLITSKRDIYFATTAPEFIQKGSKIKGLDAEEHELSSENCSPRTKVEDYSGNVFSDSDEAPNSGIHSQNSQEDGVIMSTDNLCVNITLSCDDSNPPIQRARSLQSTNSPTNAPENTLSPMTEAKRSIAKSNSCGESYTNQTGGPTELHVPPNSPKLVVTLDSTPSKKMSLTPRHIKVTTHNNEPDSPKNTLKPLRIYRIPIANLMGTNVHAHHYHYPIDDHKKISKLQTPSESAEDPTTCSVDNDDDDIFSVPTKTHLDDDDEESLLNTNNIFDQIKAQIMELNLKAGDIGTTVQSVANSLPVVVGVKPKNLSTSSSSTSSSCTNSSTVTSL